MSPLVAAALAFHLIVAVQAPDGNTVLMDVGTFADKATCREAELEFRKPPLPDFVLATACANLGSTRA